MTRGDSKPEAAERFERPIKGQAEPEANTEPGASFAVERKGGPDLEKDRLQHQVHELDPGLLRKKEERGEERTEIDANKQVLPGIGTPSPRKNESGDVGHQKACLSYDVGVRPSIEPRGPSASAEREGEPAIPATIEPVPLALRA